MARRLKTARLDLVTATTQHVLIALEDPMKLARLLAAELASPWPPPHLGEDELRETLDQLHRNPAGVDWGIRFLLRRDLAGSKPMLVGAIILGGPAKQGYTSITYGLAGGHDDASLAEEAMHAVMDWAFADEGLERLAAVAGETGGPTADLLDRLNFTPAGAGDDVGTTRYMKARQTWLDEGPPSRRCPPLRPKEASEPIKNLPPVAKKVFAQLLEEPLREIEDLRQEVRDYVVVIETAATENPYVDDILARDIARVCEGLLDAIVEETPDVTRRQIQAAARYFVTEEDGDSDLAIGGLDEDAAVANAIATHLGRDDLVSDMV
jgi:RimJ/RimL family protein N-acetyltransferase